MWVCFHCLDSGIYIFPNHWISFIIRIQKKNSCSYFTVKWGTHMQIVEFDGLPQGVTMQINDIILKGTAPIQEEKESA